MATWISRQAQVNNYLVDCLGFEKDDMQWSDLTDEQKNECEEFNS